MPQGWNSQYGDLSFFFFLTMALNFLSRMNTHCRLIPSVEKGGIVGN